MRMPMIYSMACTRSPEPSATSVRLRNYFESINIDHRWLVGEKSIFEAYKNEIERINPADNDIIIMCHDDIEIWDDQNQFIETLSVCTKNKIGFVGVAGTTHLKKEAIWWDMKQRQAGELRGFVWQGKSKEEFYPNWFGPQGRVVALDGCFMAASGKTLKNLNMDKPKYFPGDWDFYDIHYTIEAYNKGLTNLVVPIHILHNSPGELVAGRGWAENRAGFIKNERLPIKC